MGESKQIKEESKPGPLALVGLTRHGLSTRGALGTAQPCPSWAAPTVQSACPQQAEGGGGLYGGIRPTWVDARARMWPYKARLGSVRSLGGGGGVRGLRGLVDRARTILNGQYTQRAGLATVPPNHGETSTVPCDLNMAGRSLQTCNTHQMPLAGQVLGQTAPLDIRWIRPCPGHCVACPTWAVCDPEVCGPQVSASRAALLPGWPAPQPPHLLPAPTRCRVLGHQAQGLRAGLTGRLG